MQIKSIEDISDEAPKQAASILESMLNSGESKGDFNREIKYQHHDNPLKVVAKIDLCYEISGNTNRVLLKNKEDVIGYVVVTRTSPNEFESLNDPLESYKLFARDEDKTEPNKPIDVSLHYAGNLFMADLVNCAATLCKHLAKGQDSVLRARGSLVYKSLMDEGMPVKVKGLANSRNYVIQL